MERDVPYVKVGFFIVLAVSIGLALGIFLAFKNMNTDKRITYAILTDETVSGLSIGSPVKFHGLPVGVVSSIEIFPQNEQNRKDSLIVYIGVDKDVPINSSSSAVFEPAGVTGQLFVNITTPHANAQPLTAKYEGVKIIYNKPGMFEGLFDNLNKITTQVDKLLSDDNIANISGSLEAAKLTIYKLNEKLDLLDPTLKQSELTLKDISKAAKTVTGVVNDIDTQMKAGAYNVKPDIERLRVEITKATRDADALIRKLDTIMLNVEMSPVDFAINGTALQPGPGEVIK